MIEKELERLINTNIPLIVFREYDFVRVDCLISSVLGQYELEEWNPSAGLVFFDNKETKGFGGLSLEDYLRGIANNDYAKERYVVLKEVQGLLDNPGVIYSLQLIAQRRLYDARYNTSVIIVCSVLDLPEELEKYSSFLELSFPDDETINGIIDSHIAINKYDKSKFNDSDRKTLLISLKGMSEYDIDRVLDMAMSTDGSLSAADNKMILRKKKEMVKRSGVVELIEVPDGMGGSDIGGLSALKQYLQNKSKVFKDIGMALEFGVKMPKGIFLVGMPGCGKSLCAKVTAAIFGTPLLKMDMGSLMGKYVGQSEENMRKAIATAEAASPCVLWIDEIEKAFNGVGGENSEVLTRMFGYFLSWMQEKSSSVYVVATANNAEKLPPELKRKGRFDEIFCVNLPDKKEREEIFKVHINKLNGLGSAPTEDIDYGLLARNTVGFNGADIESVVNETVEYLFLDGKKVLNTYALLNTAKNTISISKSCGKQIKEMEQAFAESSFKDANTGKVKNRSDE